MGNEQVNREIAEAIDALLDLTNDGTEDDAGYQAGFADEGRRKADYIVDDLNRREAQGELRTTDLAYLCIGAADGSEVVEVVGGTGISRAVLIEISDAGAAAARVRASELAEQTGDELIVYQGDVGQRLGDAIDRLRAWFDAGEVSGLVVSAQAVIHELPRRSPNFDLPEFLGTLYSGVDWDVCGFYSREPCEPDGWPAAVRIRIPGVDGPKLAIAANHIGRSLAIDGSAKALSDHWVSLPSILAIETLHKLVRGNGIRRIRYEMGEQLTSVVPSEIQQQLSHFVPGMRVDVEYIITAGFKAALRSSQAEYVGTNLASLPVPRSHAEMIGMRGTRLPAPAASTDDGARSGRVKIKASEIEQMAMVFNGAVSPTTLLEWFGQFNRDELPLLKQMIEHFTFVDLRSLKQMLGLLATKLQLLLRGTFDDAIFVPMGEVARSGELISYLFRSETGISPDRFRHEADLTQELGDRPVVLLDDVVASGHQAHAAWRRVNMQLANRHTGPLVLGTAVSCSSGRMLLAERSQLQLCAALDLDRDTEPLVASSAVFPSPDDRRRARSMLQRYGERLAPTAPLGYAGTGLLLAFEHSMPDNCPPIFWAMTGGWKPLFRAGGSTRTLTR